MNIVKRLIKPIAVFQYQEATVQLCARQHRNPSPSADSNTSFFRKVLELFFAGTCILCTKCCPPTTDIQSRMKTIMKDFVSQFVRHILYLDAMFQLAYYTTSAKFFSTFGSH